MDSIENRVAVITGGGSGIGLAMAKRFAAEGAKVVLADIDATALDTAVAELKQSGADAMSVVTDVSDRGAIDALRDAAIKAHGKVHILCNNAGVQIAGPIWKTSDEKWKWIMDINLWGVIHGVQSFVPHMLEHGEACHIINTSSAAGLLSLPFMAAYCVTKHGVVTLTECLSQDLKHEGANIRASVLCPAFVQTNLHLSSRKMPTGEGGENAMSKHDEDAFYGAVKNLVASGVSPDEIATAVYETILEPRVHIVTHEITLEGVSKRAARILERV